MLPQHTYCGGCSQLVYTWDAAPCGQHQPLHLDVHGRRLPVQVAPPPARPAPSSARLEDQAAEQAAESKQIRETLTS
jgi:hypothetical protein